MQNGQKRNSIRRHSGPEYLKSQGCPGRTPDLYEDYRWQPEGQGTAPGPIRRRQEAGGEAEDTLSGKDASAGEWEEKVNQIRIYNGTKFETVDAASAGTVCAVTGLTQTQAGDGLGAEDEQVVPFWNLY